MGCVSFSHRKGKGKGGEEREGRRCDGLRCILDVLVGPTVRLRTNRWVKDMATKAGTKEKGEVVKGNGDVHSVSTLNLYPFQNWPPSNPSIPVFISSVSQIFFHSPQ